MKKVTKTVYVAANGVEFDDVKECIKYEKAMVAPSARDIALREIRKLKSCVLPERFKTYYNSRSEMKYWVLESAHDKSPDVLERLGKAISQHAGWLRMYNAALADLKHYRNVVKGTEEL